MPIGIENEQDLKALEQSAPRNAKHIFVLKIGDDEAYTYIRAYENPYEALAVYEIINSKIKKIGRLYQEAWKERKKYRVAGDMDEFLDDSPIGRVFKEKINRMYDQIDMLTRAEESSRNNSYGSNYVGVEAVEVVVSTP